MEKVAVQRTTANFAVKHAVNKPRKKPTNNGRNFKTGIAHIFYHLFRTCVRFEEPHGCQKNWEKPTCFA
jgi:hypothetical protein